MTAVTSVIPMALKWASPASAGPLWRQLHSVLETGSYADYMHPTCTLVEPLSATTSVYRKKHPGKWKGMGGAGAMGGESDGCESGVKGGFQVFLTSGVESYS